MEESSRSIADGSEEEIRRAVIAQYIEYRKRKGITQQDIADSMGIKRPNISRFESGNYNPSLDMLIRMADKMDLQIRNRKVDYVARSNNALSASSAYTIDPENCDISLEESDSARLDRIFQTADILEKEQMLDKYKWEKIDSFTTFNYFDINKILAFLAKAMLIERWNRLDREQGMKLFEKLVQEIKGTYKGVNYKD